MTELASAGRELAIALLGCAGRTLLLRRAVSPTGGCSVSACRSLCSELFGLLLRLAEEILDRIVSGLRTEDTGDFFAIDLYQVSRMIWETQYYLVSRHRPPALKAYDEGHEVQLDGTYGGAEGGNDGSEDAVFDLGILPVDGHDGSGRVSVITRMASCIEALEMVPAT